MVRPKHTPQGLDLQRTIKDTAWDQIAMQGAAALSLRAIARALGITAPAIYNYFPRRDDLVTALIVEAFAALGDAQQGAVSALQESDLRGRFLALGLAYRQWAIAYPQRYQLIFGTPIPGYHAPADTTVPAAAWALTPLINSLQALATHHRLKPAGYPPLTLALLGMLRAWQQFGLPVEVEVLYLSLAIWSRVHGLVSLELGQQLPSFITDGGEIYRRELDAMLFQYIKENEV